MISILLTGYDVKRTCAMRIMRITHCLLSSCTIDAFYDTFEQRIDDLKLIISMNVL